MSRALKVKIEDIKEEMEKIVIPYLLENGLNGYESISLVSRYGYERSKDWEWESNERAFTTIKEVVSTLHSPINRFQRKYGKICLN